VISLSLNDAINQHIYLNITATVADFKKQTYTDLKQNKNNKIMTKVPKTHSLLAIHTHIPLCTERKSFVLLLHYTIVYREEIICTPTTHIPFCTERN